MKSRIDGCETPEYEEGQRDKIERDPLRALEQLGEIEADQAETGAAVAETLDPESPPPQPKTPTKHPKKWRSWDRTTSAPPPPRRKRYSVPAPTTALHHEIAIESRIRSRADLAKHAGRIIYGLVTEDNRSDYERLSMGDMFEPSTVLELEVSDYNGMPMIKLKAYPGAPRISLKDPQILHYNLYAQIK